MEEGQFDALVKQVAQVRLSRLDALRGLAAGVVAGLAGVVRSEAESAAKSRHRPRTRKSQAAHGQGQPKVTICHKGQTLEVAAPALNAHLAHGDTIGPCGAPGGGTCRGLNELCGLLAGSCCPGAGIICAGGILSRCKYTCQTDKDCTARFASDYVCAQGGPICGDVSCCVRNCVNPVECCPLPPELCPS
jgi:hypothetical protein